jgi:carbonic anhydrase
VLEALFARNRAWSAAQTRRDPGYFGRLAAQQAPEFLWIGCSDSRVPANVVAGLDPGEVFVHRNVANVVHSSDLNLLSALEFAVDTLKVREIVLCGHHGCGGVRACCEEGDHGLVDHWVAPIRRLAERSAAELDACATPQARLDRLAELNVREGVRRLGETPILRKAWARGADVRVHGLIYSLVDGRLRDLCCDIDSRPPSPPMSAAESLAPDMERAR